MKTAFLMTALTVLLVLIGDYFGGLQGMIVMLSFSVIMNFYAYWNSDKMVLRHYNALARRGNLPMPKVYIIDSPVPNAFATGRNPEHAAVAVTTALYDVLDKREIAGVLGHELSHEAPLRLPWPVLLQPLPSGACSSAAATATMRATTAATLSLLC